MPDRARISLAGDYYYAKGNPLFQQTTVQAFKDAGANVSSIRDLFDLGIYFTTAVKCGKTGYSIKSSTVKECSLIFGERARTISQPEGIRADGRCSDKRPQQHRKESRRRKSDSFWFPFVQDEDRDSCVRASATPAE